MILRSKRGAGFRQFIASRLHRAVAACLMLHAAASLANCPATPAEAPAAAELPSISARLAQAWEKCVNDGPYLAYFGSIRLAEGKPDEAAALLERAMLFSPWLASARLDYAEALAAQGNIDGARAWYQEVLAHDNPPPIVRQRIEQRLATLVPKAWHSSARFSVKSGFDDNIMLSPSASSLVLTFPSGSVQLPIDSAYRKTGSPVWQVEAQVASRHVVPNDPDAAILSIFGEARYRYPTLHATARYSDLSAGMAWEKPLGDARDGASRGNTRWSAVAGLSANTVTLDGRSIFNSTRLIGGFAAPWSCQPRAIMEVERRAYPASTALAGTYLGAAFSGYCAFNGAGSITLGARFGVDKPTAAFRAGGDQTRAEARIGWQNAVAGGRLETDIWLTRLADKDGYSPLLDFGAKRTINRWLWRAEYAYPVAGGWELLANVERVRQTSNLNLFSLSGTTILFGVRTNLGW